MSELVDSEAEVGTDEEVDNVSNEGNEISEDEDEEGLDEDLEGFVVHDGEVEMDGEEPGKEEEDQDDQISPRKKKRRRERHLSEEELTDEDYDLLEENLGVKMKRKKFSRVRVASSDEDEHKEEDDREELAKQLFDSDDEGEEPSVQQPTVAGEAISSRIDDITEGESDTEVDDFIVDDKGRPVRTEDRSHLGFADSALREAEEIFGDGFEFDKIQEELEEDFDEEDEDEYDYEDDDMDGARKKKKKKKADVNIYDIYEPFDLEKGHFTMQDHEIKMTDLPERFQIRAHPVEAADDMELEQEAAWVFKLAFNTKPVSFQGEVDEFGQIMMWTPKPRSAENRIKGVLKLIRNDKYEVPFIMTYRKEIIQDDLNCDDLWKIYEWDEKWMRLSKRKEKLKKLMMKVQQYQFERTRESSFMRSERILEAEDIDRVDLIQTQEEYGDVFHHFNLYYNTDIIDMQNQATANATLDGLGTADQCKLSQKRNGYTMCKDGNLGNLAKSFGLTSIQFAENLSDQYNRHTVEQSPLMPEDAAKEFECRRFPTPEKVLAATRYMIASQIAAEPAVRQSVRQAFCERALLTITPTSAGINEIDLNHMWGPFKFIKDKPVKDLSGEEFLKMVGAVKEGFISMSLSVDVKGTKDTYVEEIKMFYYRDEFSQLVQNWNEQRTEALSYALNKILYPMLQKELIQKLTEEAIIHVLQKCKMKLRRSLQMAPFTVENLDESAAQSGIRVLGVAVRDDLHDQPGYCILINGEGEVEEAFNLPYLRYNGKGNADWAKGKKDDMEKLQEFLLEHKPHVIGLCCHGGRAMIYQKEFQEIVTSLEQQHQIDPIAIELVDPSLSQLYKATNRAESEFPHYQLEQRMAVSVARRLRDPLVEFSQLCNFNNDILSLSWHPLQRFLNSERLLSYLYSEFIVRVNEVGVDLNFAVDHYHYQSMVQFACGLGPRKGSALLKLLKQTSERLESRTALVTNFKLGSKVFLNCAGFIRIENTRDDSLNENVQLLDSTRIHPETYIWATKMAIDALEYDDDDEENVKQRALEEIVEDPEKLRDLDLDAFAIELERQEYPDKRITLYDIRDELTNRFADKRVPYHALTAEERFYLLSNETPESFKEGIIVQCTVYNIARRKPKGDEPDIQPKRNEENGMWQCPLCLRDDFPELSEIWNHFDTTGSCPGQAVGIRVRLDNNLTGFIATKNISDSKIANPEERIRVGKRINAKVIRINFDKYAVDLSCKSSDLNSPGDKHRDPYYDTEAEDRVRKQKEAKKNKNNKTNQYINRVIVHPNFKNISYSECERILREQEQGSVIIRPSRKGTGFLTLTWKVDQTANILSHLEIVEEEKDNQFSLGKKLRINEEEYEDLDEIVARFVDPMAKFARDIISFKYFKDSVTMDTMNTLLRNDKALTPKRVPYYITACPKRPGRFTISYMPRTQPHHESITVTHIGYKFRGKTHESFPSLVKWFKEHWSDARPMPIAKAATHIGDKSMASEYTADFTDFTEPFQTPRSGAFSDTASVVDSIYGANRTPAFTLTPKTPSHSDFRTPPTPGMRTPGTRTPGARTPGARTPGYTGSRTPGGSRIPSHTMPTGSRTPGQRTPGHVTPGHMTPGAMRTPGHATPGSRTPASRTPGGRTPGHVTPGGRTPGHVTPGGRTPGHLTPGGSRAGGSRTPGHGTPTGNRTPGYHGSRTPGHRTPGYKSPGTPGHRTPAGHRSPRDQYHQGYPGRSPHYPSPARSGSRTPINMMEPPQVSPRPRTPVASS